MMANLSISNGNMITQKYFGSACTLMKVIIISKFPRLSTCFYLTGLRCIGLNYGKNLDSSSRLEVFCKKGALKYFAKFTGKYLFWSLFFN